jgi:hypothetical protein
MVIDGSPVMVESGVRQYSHTPDAHSGEGDAVENSDGDVDPEEPQPGTVTEPKDATGAGADNADLDPIGTGKITDPVTITHESTNYSTVEPSSTHTSKVLYTHHSRVDSGAQDIHTEIRAHTTASGDSTASTLEQDTTSEPAQDESGDLEGKPEKSGFTWSDGFVWFLIAVMFLVILALTPDKGALMNDILTQVLFY